MRLATASAGVCRYTAICTRDSDSSMSRACLYAQMSMRPHRVVQLPDSSSTPESEFPLSRIAAQYVASGQRRRGARVVLVARGGRLGVYAVQDEGRWHPRRRRTARGASAEQGADELARL